MIENSLAFFEKERLPLEERVTLSLATVQGSWNAKSKEILIGRSFNELKLEEETVDEFGNVQKPSLLEKRLIPVITKMITAFVGDGSAANLIFGHSVTLSEEDRGIVTLLSLVKEENIPEASDWVLLALFSAEIGSGKTIQEITNAFEKKIGKFKGFFGWIAKKFASKEEREEMERTSSETEDEVVLMFKHLKEVLGESEEEVLNNKNKVQKDLIRSLKSELKSQSFRKLTAFSKELGQKPSSGDEILTTSYAWAGRFLKELLAEELGTS